MIEIPNTFFKFSGTFSCTKLIQTLSFYFSTRFELDVRLQWASDSNWMKRQNRNFCVDSVIIAVYQKKYFNSHILTALFDVRTANCKMAGIRKACINDCSSRWSCFITIVVYGAVLTMTHQKKKRYFIASYVRFSVIKRNRVSITQLPFPVIGCTSFTYVYEFSNF